jgi:hypothetical protein
MGLADFIPNVFKPGCVFHDKHVLYAERPSFGTGEGVIIIDLMTQIYRFGSQPIQMADMARRMTKPALWPSQHIGCVHQDGAHHVAVIVADYPADMPIKDETRAERAQSNAQAYAKQMARPLVRDSGQQFIDFSTVVPLRVQRDWGTMWIDMRELLYGPYKSNAVACLKEYIFRATTEWPSDIGCDIPTGAHLFIDVGSGSAAHIHRPCECRLGNASSPTIARISTFQCLTGTKQQSEADTMHAIWILHLLRHGLITVQTPIVVMACDTDVFAILLAVLWNHLVPGANGTGDSAAGLMENLYWDPCLSSHPSSALANRYVSVSGAGRKIGASPERRTARHIFVFACVAFGTDFVKATDIDISIRGPFLLNAFMATPYDASRTRTVVDTIMRRCPPRVLYLMDLNMDYWLRGYSGKLLARMHYMFGGVDLPVCSFLPRADGSTPPRFVPDTTVASVSSEPSGVRRTLSEPSGVRRTPSKRSERPVSDVQPPAAPQVRPAIIDTDSDINTPLSPILVHMCTPE